MIKEQERSALPSFLLPRVSDHWTGGVMSRLIAIILGLLASAHSVLAQTYPSKPIRWIVPFTAGSATDVTLR